MDVDDLGYGLAVESAMIPKPEEVDVVIDIKVGQMLQPIKQGFLSSMNGLKLVVNLNAQGATSLGIDSSLEPWQQGHHYNNLEVLSIFVGSLNSFGDAGD